LLATEAASCFEHGDQGGTFNGNALMCAAGLAVVTELSRPGTLDIATATGNFMANELTKLSGRHSFRGVRGRGLLLALDFGRPIGSQIVAHAFEAGLLLNAPRPDALRFMPSLTVTHAEIAEMIATLDRLLRDHIANLL
jgi:acetylornithine/N-succinyldiaminopimelate aminotransferase